MRNLALICALATAALTGCGDESVDTGAIETQMQRQLSTTETQVESVKCPDDVDEGETFRCDVAWSNGAKGKAEVRPSGDDQYTYAPVAGSVKIPGKQVEGYVADSLAQQGAPDAAVSCPETMTVELGKPFTCDVSGAGGKAGGTVTFTFSSAEGEVDASSVEVS